MSSGIDLTRRDLRVDAKDKQRLWDVTKGIDHSAPAEIDTIEQVGHIENTCICLSVNGEKTG